MNNFIRSLSITSVILFLASSPVFAQESSVRAAVILDASQHAFIPNETANSNGVYPVRITWKKPANDAPAFYQVQRSARSGTGFSRVNAAALPANGPWTDAYSYNSESEVYTYIDRNETAAAGVKYYYRVLSLNRQEQGNNFSQEKIGWGALTHEKFFFEFNKTYASAIYKLTYMHKRGNLRKLGEETTYGTISGQIYYKARVVGLHGDITVTTTNYCDYFIDNDPAKGPYFVLNGDSGSTANMATNGSMKPVTIICTGMYPGTVYHGNVQIKGAVVAGGTYGVTPNGFPRKELPWTLGYFNQIPLPDSMKDL
ncbi:MAG: hypothetical protein FWB73_07150 [Treponema sp.]|nr:hypothetical protein [Treponema sp.]